MTALSYLLHMGGTQNKDLIEISVIIFTVWADWTSRNLQDSRKWRFCPTVLKQICSHLGKPLLDLFASRLCHQLPQYIVWGYQFLYAFSSFWMIGRVLRKVKKDQINMIIVTPAWQSQSWHPVLLKMINPVLLPNHSKVLLSRENSSFNSKLVTETGGMDIIRQSLSSKRISDRVEEFSVGRHPKVCILMGGV